jgi:hypothetical protein
MSSFSYYPRASIPIIFVVAPCRRADPSRAAAFGVAEFRTNQTVEPMNACFMKETHAEAIISG